RPARHPHRPGHRLLRHRHPADRGRLVLRRLPNVSPQMTTTPTPTVTTVLVANRGEIARRVFATCRRLGISTVAVHSDADAELPFVAEADRAVRLPGSTPAETYLRGDLVIE